MVKTRVNTWAQDPFYIQKRVPAIACYWLVETGHRALDQLEMGELGFCFPIVVCTQASAEWGPDLRIQYTQTARRMVTGEQNEWIWWVY